MHSAWDTSKKSQGTEGNAADGTLPCVAKIPAGVLGCCVVGDVFFGWNIKTTNPRALVIKEPVVLSTRAGVSIPLSWMAASTRLLWGRAAFPFPFHFPLPFQPKLCLRTGWTPLCVGCIWFLFTCSIGGRIINSSKKHIVKPHSNPTSFSSLNNTQDPFFRTKPLFQKEPSRTEVFVILSKTKTTLSCSECQRIKQQAWELNLHLFSGYVFFPLLLPSPLPIGKNIAWIHTNIANEKGVVKFQVHHK